MRHGGRARKRLRFDSAPLPPSDLQLSVPACVPALVERAVMEADLDSDIVVLCQSGHPGHVDKGASLLVERYASKMISFARGHGDREEADDLVYICLMQAVQHINQFKGDGSFRSWLFAILSNLCKTSLRPTCWRRTLQETAELGQVVSRRDHINEFDWQDFLAEGLRRLPDDERDAFNLRFNGLKYDEIAQVQAVTEGVVAARIRTARFLLQQFAEKQGLVEWTFYFQEVARKKGLVACTVDR